MNKNKGMQFWLDLRELFFYDNKVIYNTTDLRNN